MKNFQGSIQGRQAPIGVMEYLWKLKQYLRATESHRLNFLTFIRRQQRMSLFLCFNLKNCYRKQFSRTSAAQTFLKQMTVGLSVECYISTHPVHSIKATSTYHVSFLPCRILSPSLPLKSYPCFKASSFTHLSLNPILSSKEMLHFSDIPRHTIICTDLYQTYIT